MTQSDFEKYAGSLTKAYFAISQLPIKINKNIKPVETMKNAKCGLVSTGVHRNHSSFPDLELKVLSIKTFA